MRAAWIIRATAKLARGAFRPEAGRRIAGCQCCEMHGRAVETVQSVWVAHPINVRAKDSGQKIQQRVTAAIEQWAWNRFVMPRDAAICGEQAGC